jgi:hypothetical protein
MSGWGWDVQKARYAKQRDLCGNRMVFMCRIPAGEPTGKKSHRIGVRVSIVALKPGNSGGAKGHREMDAS